MAGDFFDSNVLLYLASGDDRKADRAESVLSRGGSVSVQVLNEITNVARRKMGLSWIDTRQFLATLRTLVTVHPVTLQIHESGLELAEKFGFAIYDAMIAASALDAGCERLWSEDFQHGLHIDGKLRILNPFAAN